MHTTPNLSLRTLSIFGKLRERRLTQIVISYLAAGWVVLEVADQFTERGLIPDFVYQVALTWYLVGIPACLLIGWYHGEKGEQQAPRSEIAALLGLAGLAAFLSVSPVSEYLSGVQRAAAAASSLNLRRVGVMYFNDISRGKQQQYLADGLTEDLITELGSVRNLDVISRNGMVQFRQSDASPDSIAQALNAGTLVDGTVERVGDKLRVDVRLLDGTSGSVFKSAEFERPAADLLAVREELVKEVSGFLREWVGEEVRLRDTRAETESPAAWALLQRAEKARKDAERALGQDDLAAMDRAFAQADTLLMQAETLDPDWAEPAVLRGRIAYRRARTAEDPHEAVTWVQRGLEHAEQALQRAGGSNAEALELRGTLHYFAWLLGTTPEPTARDEQLRAARADLERAVQQDPTLASAHSTLSHLYYRDDIPSAVLAARRAYEEDAYLDVANEVLWRLSLGSYDLEQFDQMKRWCDEGGRRFPQDFRFTECQLWWMTTPASQPAAPQAWQLLARLDSLTPEPRQEYEHARGLLLVGGVLARAGAADSARAVLQRADAAAGYGVDPTRELQQVAAYMWTLLGRNDNAIRLLKQYAGANPGSSFEHHWWWRALRGDPAFQDLAGHP